MSAPVLWVILPILIGGFILLLSDERSIAISGGFASLALAVLALIIPIDEALLFGPISLKVASSASFLGRSLVIPPTEAPLLAVIFGLCAIWFFGSEAAGVAGRLVPLGMIITGLLVASIAVQPFLYAALLIEMAVLAAVPLLSAPTQRPSPGVMRFLIYQTLGMPFILFSGWLLTGVEASPGDLSLTVQSTVMLGLGFAFLLAIFPLSDWIPRVIEASSPYAAGFILWLLLNLVAVFAMGFLDRYAWLRTSSQVVLGLRAMGLIMVIVGGLWSIVERQMGRLLGFAGIAETGFLLLAISQAAANNSAIVFWFFIPRGLALAVWALALSVLKAGGATMDLSGVRGLARRYPWASGGIVLAALSVGGFPLLAGFPPRLGLWAGLAHTSLITAGWFLVGLFGLMIGAIRQLSALIVSEDATGWTSAESRAQRGMLGFGALGLLLLGIFPQLLDFILGRLPSMFEHLAR